MFRFNQQNTDQRFGSFVFGPVVMRMYYHLDKPNESLKVDGLITEVILFRSWFL